MKELPKGWVRAPLHELARVQLGRQRSPKNHQGMHMRPYMRAANVTWNGLDLSDVKEMNFDPDEAPRFELQPGDLLLAEASGSASEVGKPVLWKGEVGGACFQNTLLRVQTNGPLPEYLLYYFKLLAITGAFATRSRGVGIHHLGKLAMEQYDIPVAPLSEQRRIVDAIEESFSRIDAAALSTYSAQARCRQLRRSFVAELLRNDWPLGQLGDVTTNFDGRRVPVKASDRSGTQGEYPYYGASGVIDHVDQYLFDGDYVLIAEDGANLLSRSKPIAFPATGKFWVNNHAHVVQVTEKVRPEFLMAYLNQVDLSRSVTGSAQPKLTQRNLNTVSIPIPPITVQDGLAEQLAELDSVSSASNALISSVQRKCDTLRQAVMSTAFSGHLVPHDPDDEPASVLLERIETERHTFSYGRSRRKKVTA